MENLPTARTPVRIPKQAATSDYTTTTDLISTHRQLHNIIMSMVNNIAVDIRRDRTSYIPCIQIGGKEGATNP
jgi:hypothetical protein